MDKKDDSTISKISIFLTEQKPGTTFNYGDFSSCGSYTSIRTAVGRLCERKELIRLTQGIYMKPAKIGLDESIIAMEIERKNGSRAKIHKDEQKGSTRIISILTTGSTRTLTLSEGTVLKYIHSNLV